MKIFNKTEKWSEKVNFIDDNNVVLGYDIGHQCCEYADWFIANEIKKEIIAREQTEDGTPTDMPGWIFDTKFIKRVYSNDCSELGDGEMVVFRIINDNKEKYIHIFNAHNGYYGHGFEFSDNDFQISASYI